MAYTAAQWAALQARLPLEDRVSYADYLASLPTSQTPQATAATPAQTSTPTAAQMRAVDAVLSGRATPSEVAIAQTVAPGIQTPATTAQSLMGQAQSLSAALSNINAATQAASAAIAAGNTAEAQSILQNATTAAQGAAQQMGIAAPTATAAPTTPAATAAAGGVDPQTQALIDSLQKQISDLTNLTTQLGQSQATAQAQAQAAALQAATVADTAAAERQSVMDTLINRFNQYGLGSLANTIRTLAIDGATEATITLALQETPEYQQRFAANAARLKNNLRVLSPSEYIGLEDGYRQVLRAYGLNQFDTDQYVQQFIANDMSAAELSDRVVTAVQRVQNADPAVSRTLRDYYGIGQADLVAYVLDPQQQLQKIQRQVAAAEIGTAARIQGLEAGVGVAEQLAAQGITQAEAQRGYATIADILPTAEKLSAIYGDTMGGYGQSQAEQEVFNQLASAQRRREALVKREQAAFSGQSGLARTALGGQPSRGQF